MLRKVFSNSIARIRSGLPRVIFSENEVNVPPLESSEEKNYFKLKTYEPRPFNSRLTYFKTHLSNNLKEYPTVFVPDDLMLDGIGPAAALMKNFKTNNEDDGKAISELNSALGSQLKDSNPNDLLLVLHFFANNQYTIRKKDMICLLKTLDEALWNNCKTITYDEQLKYLHALYPSPFFKEIYYAINKLTKLCFKMPNLTKNQVVHLHFLLTKFRKFPVKDSKYRFQCSLAEIIPLLSVEEFMCICFALIRFRLCISHDKFFDNAFNFVNDNIEKMNDENLFSVTQLVLENGSTHSTKNLPQHQENLLPYMNRFKVYSLANLAVASVFLSSCNQKFLYKLLEMAKSNISDCNVTALKRLTFVCASYNIQDGEFLKLAVQSLKERKIENEVSLASLIKFLICLGIKDDELFRMVLSKSIVADVFKNMSIKEKLDLFFIDNTVELDMPEYEGPRLSQQAKFEIHRISTVFSTSENNEYLNNQSSKLMWEVEKAIQNVCGGGLTVWKRIGYCYPPTIIMKFDKDIEPEVIDHKYKFAKYKSMLRPLNDGHIWTAFTVLNSRNYGFDGNIDLITRTRNQHWEKMGYKNLVLTSDDIFEHKKTNSLGNFILNRAKEQLQKPAV